MDALLIPIAMVVLFFGVMAYLAWRQDHPKR
jgi:preprotein translocase subunit YajC